MAAGERQGNFAGSWSGWCRKTLALAAQVRDAQPEWSWPQVSAMPRSMLLAELTRLQPALIDTTFARQVSDERLLLELLDACTTVDHYQRERARRGT